MGQNRLRLPRASPERFRAQRILLAYDFLTISERVANDTQCSGSISRSNVRAWRARRGDVELNEGIRRTCFFLDCCIEVTGPC